MLEDEETRLSALYSYGVLDSDPEEAFDRVVRLAARLFAVPMAVISLTDRERQWYKAKVGIAAKDSPRELSICAQALTAREPLVVMDARDDQRFQEAPLVAGPPHIRFYAGTRLTTPAGFHIGTLSVFGPQPRLRVAPAELSFLQDLSEIVVSELEHRRLRRDAARALPAPADTLEIEAPQAWCQF